MRTYLEVLKVVAAVTATAGIALLAGCSSGTTAAQARASAAGARAQITPQIKALYQKFYGEHVGWADHIDSFYNVCVADTGPTKLSYHNDLDYLIAFKGIRPVSYDQDIVRILRSEGWKVTLDDSDKPGGGPWASHYDVAKGQLRGDVSVQDPIALLRFYGPCFSAGPSPDSIDKGGDNILLPHPTPLPS